MSDPAQLINFARRLDPGLTGEDFACAGLELDQLDDRAFAETELSQHQVIALRERFAAEPPGRVRAELPVIGGLREQQQVLMAAWLTGLRSARTRGAYARG